MAITTSSLTHNNAVTAKLTVSSQVQESQQHNTTGHSMFVRMLPTLVINALVPFTVNMVAQHFMPTIDSLLLASAVPALYTLGMFAWKKHVDAIGMLVVASLLLTAIFALLFRSPRLLLLQGSAVNGLFGIAMLVSLLFSRPFLFYIIRSVVTQNNPERVSHFNASWASPRTRHFYRLMTTVWGCVTVGQLLLITALVFTLPISLMLIISPIMSFAIITPVAHWSMIMMRKYRRS